MLPGWRVIQRKDILATEDELTREERERNPRVNDRIRDVYPAPPKSK